MADAITETQWEFYKIQASVVETTTSWLDFAKSSSPKYVGDLEGMRSYVRLCAKDTIPDGIMWADQFAFMVIAEVLGLTILFIDMERGDGCYPFRILEQPSSTRKELIRNLPKQKQDNGTMGHEGKAMEEEEEESEVNMESRYLILRRDGGAGHFLLLQSIENGQSLFLHSELPNVITQLWGLNKK